MGKKKHDLPTVLDAIRGKGRFSPPDPKKDGNSFGNASVVAKRLGVSRQTIHNYLNTWKTAKEAMEEARQTFGDFVEGKMAEEIMKGNTAMIIFYAKTQMKNRGYVERQQVQSLNLDMSQLTTEQLERIAKGEDVYHVIATTG